MSILQTYNIYTQPPWQQAQKLTKKTHNFVSFHPTNNLLPPIPLFSVTHPYIFLSPPKSHIILFSYKP